MIRTLIFVYFLLIIFSVDASDFVRINHCNNQANSFGYGAVDYSYDIGKYEITNQQYCDFLNHVAGRQDSYRLFSPLMEQHFMGGIVRMDTSGGRYRYVCKKGYEKRPVVCVTWMSAIRFCNWLHYNAGNIERNTPVSQWETQTEGDDCHGAYDTRSVPKCRNEGAMYWLPNRSEWEKAAYYDGKRWLGNTLRKGSNCFDSENGWAVSYPHVAEVGLAEGPNGTFDQQGNAAEWIENSLNDGTWKLALGGSLIRSPDFAFCGVTEGDDPNKSISTFGFRVCRSTERRHDGIKEAYLPDPVKVSAPEFTTDLQGTSYVFVADVDNPGDPVNRFKGTVPYEYYISRTELSNAEYCTFLNAVAVKSDPYRLYDRNMGESVCGGILRIETDSGFRYVCKAGWERKPVVYLAYYDLARYANWLHYGCPQKGVSILGTTEGTKSHGAYNTEDFQSIRRKETAPYKKFGRRNAGARFWIPDENEWYKAAYYDPTVAGVRKYHDYPTRTSDPPTHSQANYIVDNELALGYPYFVADVDAYGNAASYYGTLQQGGNVWEWIESWQYGVVGIRGLRGGSWSYTAYGLNACNTDPGGIDDRGYVFGGRLCMAVCDTGWQPARRPLLRSFYEFILLLPMSRILLLAVAFLSLLTFFSIVSVYKMIQRICGKH